MRWSIPLQVTRLRALPAALQCTHLPIVSRYETANFSADRGKIRRRGRGILIVREGASSAVLLFGIVPRKSAGPRSQSMIGAPLRLLHCRLATDEFGDMKLERLNAAWLPQGDGGHIRSLRGRTAVLDATRRSCLRATRAASIASAFAIDNVIEREDGTADQGGSPFRPNAISSNYQQVPAHRCWNAAPLLQCRRQA